MWVGRKILTDSNKVWKEMNLTCQEGCLVRDDLKLLDDGPNLKEEVGSLIPGCKISSLLDRNLAMACQPYVPKTKRKKERKKRDSFSCCKRTTIGPSVSMQLANFILKLPCFRNVCGLHMRGHGSKEGMEDGEWWMTRYHLDLHATAGLLHAIFGMWKATFSGTWMDHRGSHFKTPHQCTPTFSQRHIIGWTFYFHRFTLHKFTFDCKENEYLIWVILIIARFLIIIHCNICK